jgi:LmbE family N-acetylglucosaminyl deacetylase
MKIAIEAIKIRLSHVLLTALAFSLIISAPRAQQPAATTQQSSDDRIALYQALLDLTNPWTVMCVAAHPDDEDGTSLIVMRRKYGAHTVSLFSTFGEGGQNAIGPELYEELGAIRARETMAAAEIQGSEPHFLGLKDFGYSKSPEETFQKWGHEEALRRMVLEIRKLRPDVIITNHSVTNNDHGHHQATARLVLEAFDAAADPSRFPEQLKDGVTTWQVQRLFVRVRGQNPDRQGGGDQMVTVDPNERDPVRGTVFAEQALAALQKHATQGPWPKTFAEFTARFRAFTGQSGATGQMPLIRYRLAREAKGAGALTSDAKSFFDGLQLSQEEAEIIKAPTINGKPLTESVGQRQQIVDALDQEWKRLINHLMKQTFGLARVHDRASLYYQRLYLAILSANGVSARLVGPDVLVPGRMAKFSLVVSNNGASAVNLHEKEAAGAPQEEATEGMFMPCCEGVSGIETLAPGKSKIIEVQYEVPAGTRITVPNSLHLDENSFGTYVTTSVALKIGQFFDFAVAASKVVSIGRAIDIDKVIPAPLILTPQTADNPVTFTVRVVNNQTEPVKATLSAQGQKIDLDLASQATKEVAFRVPKISVQQSELAFTLRGSAAESLIVPVAFANAKVAENLKVGYVRGFDFSLPNALDALGVESKELRVDEVKTSDLSKYTSIMVDNRVYESQPDLIAVNQKLLEYANAGGNLIVFYHKSDEWNPDPRRKRPQLAPYKLILGNERITDENAPVTFLEPEHPLLNAPNKLNQDDFKDWIQERGLYYPRDWDPQFHALLQSNDPGEAPLKGGLLIADYGSGHYIYTSMVWYRQLRAGVPGAYRMLANMISYGRK